MYDNVNKPQHYTEGGIECIDAMIQTQGVSAVIDFCVCNAFKYIWRHNRKNGNEDLFKAQWYINKACELIGNSDKKNPYEKLAVRIDDTVSLEQFPSVAEMLTQKFPEHAVSEATTMGNTLTK